MQRKGYRCEAQRVGRRDVDRSCPHTVGEARCYLPVSGVGSRVMNQLVTPRTSASAVTW